MRVHVEHRQHVPGHPDVLMDAFRADPAGWLPAPVRPAGPRRWRLELHAGPAQHEAIVEIGSAGAVPGGSSRTIRWWAPVTDGLVANRSDLIPELFGHMTLHTEAGGAVLSIAGDYEPPGGALGALADLVLGRRVARSTVQWMASAIQQGLSSGTSAAA